MAKSSRGRETAEVLGDHQAKSLVRDCRCTKKWRPLRRAALTIEDPPCLPVQFCATLDPNACQSAILPAKN